MGICNVLAVVPFLCAGAPEEPEQEQEEEQVGHVIEAQPAPEVDMGVLNSPSDATVRSLAEYEVMPPSTIYRDGLSEEEIQAAQAEAFAAEEPQNFGDWVGQNYAGQQDVEAPPTLALRTEEPEVPVERRQPVVVATSTPTSVPTIAPAREPIVREPVRQAPIVVAEPVAVAAVIPEMDMPNDEPIIVEQGVMANEVDLATLYAPAQPVPAPIGTYTERPVQPAAMTLGPRATPLSAIKAEEAAEIEAIGVVFTDPVAFTERGESIAAEGIAQRKRQRFRSAMREYRRELRRAGQDS